MCVSCGPYKLAANGNFLLFIALGLQKASAVNPMPPGNIHYSPLTIHYLNNSFNSPVSSDAGDEDGGRVNDAPAVP